MNTASQTVLVAAVVVAFSAGCYFLTLKQSADGAHSHIGNNLAASRDLSLGNSFMQREVGRGAEGLPDVTSEAEKSRVHGVAAERTGHLRGAIRRSPVLDEQTKALILDCVHRVGVLQGVKSSADFTTLTDYYGRALLMPPGRRIEAKLQYRNVRLLDQNGQRLSLYISRVFDESSGKTKFAPRLYATNDENLEVPRDLPPELQGPNWASAVDRMKGNGQMVSDEISEDQRLDSKTTAHLILHNGRIENLEIFFNGGKLACTRNDERASAICQCF